MFTKFYPTVSSIK